MISIPFGFVQDLLDAIMCILLAETTKIQLPFLLPLMATHGISSSTRASTPVAIHGLRDAEMSLTFTQITKIKLPLALALLVRLDRELRQCSKILCSDIEGLDLIIEATLLDLWAEIDQVLDCGGRREEDRGRPVRLATRSSVGSRLLITDFHLCDPSPELLDLSITIVRPILTLRAITSLRIRLAARGFDRRVGHRHLCHVDGRLLHLAGSRRHLAREEVLPYATIPHR